MLTLADCAMLNETGRTISEVRLLRNMRTTTALVNRVKEDADIDEQEGTGGGVRYSYDVYYGFQLSGSRFDGHTTLDYNPLEEDSSKTLESEVRKDGSTYYPLKAQSVIVAYDSGNPANNRVQEKLPSIFGTIISHAIVLVVLGAFAALGIRFIRSGLIDLRESNEAERSTGRPYTKEQLDHSTRIFLSGGGGEKAALESLAYLEQEPTEDESESISPTAVSNNTRLAALLRVPAALLGVPDDRVTEALDELRKRASEPNASKSIDNRDLDPEKRRRLAQMLGVSEDQTPEAVEHLKREVSEKLEKLARSQDLNSTRDSQQEQP